jgi:hypothetical protein
LSKRKRHKAGQVIWARVADRNGVVKENPRPLLVIKPDPIGQSHLCCLAISTRPGDDPDDPAIEMPWDAATGETTGLYAWCRVVLLWFVPVAQGEVVEISGAVTPSFLERVIAERAAAELRQLGRKQRP